MFPDYRLYLRISDRNLCYEIDLKNENIKQIYDNKNIVKPFLKLNVTNTLLTMILINHISWNMADFFIDYEREPNIYNQGKS